MTGTTIVTEEFRHTEIGALPREWGLATLGDLFHVQQGKALSPKSRQGISPRPFLRTANVLWGHLDLSVVDQMDFSEDETVRLALQSGDLLVCEGGDIGRTAMWCLELPDCYYQNHIHRLRRKTDNVFPEYYMYWMQAALLLLDLYMGQANRTTIPNLSGARLKSFVVPVPPLTEQKKIAYVLSTVQTAIEKTEALIKTARELKKSLMKHLFTYGPVSVDEAENVPLKETAIGLVPESWDVVKLGDVVRTQYGYTASACHNQVGPQFLRITDIDDDGNVNWSAVPYCMVPTDDYHRFFLEDGDTVVARIGATTGKAYYVVNCPRSVFASYLLRLKVKDEDKVYPAFISAFTKSAAYWTQVNQSKGEKLKSGLSAKQLEQILIPLPPFQIQKPSAIALSVIDRKLEIERNKKAALQALFNTVLSNLTTGNIRVDNLEVPI